MVAGLVHTKSGFKLKVSFQVARCLTAYGQMLPLVIIAWRIAADLNAVFTQIMEAL